MTKQVLLADDEPNLRKVLGAQLTRDGFDVLLAEDGAEALALLREHHVDVVISDLRMPRVDGLTLLKTVVAEYPELPVILITAHGTVDTAVEAIKLGAFDYVTKPFDRDEFKHVVDKAVRSRELSLQSAPPVAAAADVSKYHLIGTSTKMKEVFSVLDRVANTPSTVLVTGESGTGKELVAKALHEHSARVKKPFIRVNCAAIPAELIESELFGYEKGAFTGAVTSKPGRFELAHEGTLFLDEIAEIPVSMQVKLLRAIQEQEFERVGGVKTIRVDVRFVAATNRDLVQEMRAGRFREDLFYRLNVVHVELPPLRQRTADIPILVNAFLARFRERLGKRNLTAVSEQAMERLCSYPWPGNIRQLENVMERCVIFADGDVVDVSHFPADMQDETDASGSDSAPPGEITADESFSDSAPGSVGLKDLVKEASERIEKEFIARALEQTQGNVTRAAKLLRISRKSLQTKMKDFGLRELKEEA